MSNEKSQRDFFKLLREFARSQQELSLEKIEAATGWRRATFPTYYKKQFEEFMEPRGKNYVVSSHFLRVTWPEFRSHVTQKKRFYGQYRRYSFDRVVTYEFLLPLTKEDKLRQALDDLFYEETLEQRLSEIKHGTLQKVLPRKESESDVQYKKRVIAEISGLIGGYSIQHVNGRFKAADLMAKEQAVQFERENGKKYIHDETSAVVRFIIPCPSSRKSHGSSFDYSSKTTLDSDLWDNDLKLIRTIFFEFFVEAVVKTVRGEDEVWLIEHAAGRKLYVFEKT